ncbi:uncharacterized protein G2W53_029611 [Senna tora]|uniref:Uncharacterized protein n=1 Tax=Senna tora TaxID=362788 RepID=A0A834T7X7_9FABA|nr:uncharacterized protein G2W53_029611 [Senna tora]
MAFGAFLNFKAVTFVAHSRVRSCHKLSIKSRHVRSSYLEIASIVLAQ